MTILDDQKTNYRTSMSVSAQLEELAADLRTTTTNIEGLYRFGPSWRGFLLALIFTLVAGFGFGFGFGWIVKPGTKIEYTQECLAEQMRLDHELEFYSDPYVPHCVRVCGVGNVKSYGADSTCECFGAMSASELED